MNIVKLNVSDFAITSEQLSLVFSHDPLITHFLPEKKAAKLTSLKHCTQALLNYAQSYDCIYTTAENPKGVAIWLPPEASQFNLLQLWQIVRAGFITLPFYLRWDRIFDLISFIATELQLHQTTASEPHWYLAMLGVLPECQGQGIGGKLIQPVLQEADKTKMPCYLETSTAAAVRFYQRYGFEIVHHGIFAQREYWTMKRKPQVIEKN
jgi:ribosomal protein S18 acetylase RimI-like enzyme